MPPRHAFRGANERGAYYAHRVAGKDKDLPACVHSSTVEPSRIRVLVTAFAPVPGSSPHSAAVLGMAGAVRGELDLVSLKTDALPHVEVFEASRMFRVPVGDADPLEQRRIFDRAVARQLEAERYDVVHVRGPFEGKLAAERKAELGFALVYEMATFPDEALGAEVEQGWSEAHRACLTAADRVLVPTEAARRAASDLVPEERVLVVPPGVDLGQFDWRPAPQNRRLRLLYLGSFTADRDLATLLGAVRRVRATRDLEVLVAGESDRGRRERLRRMADAFGLADVVDIRGEPATRALPAIIGSADLCLATASQDPRFQALGDLPQPLLEYLACHRPVVAAGVPGVAEVLRDEQEGLLYPPGDDAALAEAILEMMRDAELRERLTQAGYRRAREMFSSGARRRRVQEAYEGLVSGSQVADAWAEGFPEGKTGEIELPAGNSDPGTLTASAEPLPGEEPVAADLHPTAAGDEPAPSDFAEPSDFSPLLGTDGSGDIGPEPVTSEMELLPEMEGEATQARAEPHLGTDPGARVGPRADTDPGSHP